MSVFKDFFNLWNGKPVEMEDPENFSQCFDLAFAWCDFIKVPRSAIRHLHAYQIYEEPNDETVKYFWFVPSTPTNYPSEGDLVVFGQGVGISGHVSIASGKGDSNTFESFDQNWSGVQYARLVIHKYTSVLGWLHLKVESNLPSEQIIQQSDTFIAICEKLQKPVDKDIVLTEIDSLLSYEEIARQKGQKLDEANKRIEELIKQGEEVQILITGLKDENQKLTVTVGELEKTTNTTASENERLLRELGELRKANTEPILSNWKQIIIEILKRI